MRLFLRVIFFALLLPKVLGAASFSALCSNESLTLNAKFQEAVWSQGTDLPITQCYEGTCGTENSTATGTYLCVWDIRVYILG